MDSSHQDSGWAIYCDPKAAFVPRAPKRSRVFRFLLGMLMVSAAQLGKLLQENDARPRECFPGASCRYYVFMLPPRAPRPLDAKATLSPGTFTASGHQKALSRTMAPTHRRAPTIVPDT